VHLHRNLHVARDLLAAAVAHIHRVGVERTVAMLGVAAAPIDLEEQLPIRMERLKRIDEIDHLTAQHGMASVS
jgi:hypothetical protein